MACHFLAHHNDSFPFLRLQTLPIKCIRRPVNTCPDQNFMYSRNRWSAVEIAGNRPQTQPLARIQSHDLLLFVSVPKIRGSDLFEPGIISVLKPLSHFAWLQNGCAAAIPFTSSRSARRAVMQRALLPVNSSVLF